MQSEGQAVIDNESRELLAVHHTGFIVAEAGQIYRDYTNSDHGIDGEIEFNPPAPVAADVRRRSLRASGRPSTSLPRWLPIFVPVGQGFVGGVDFCESMARKSVGERAVTGEPAKSETLRVTT